MDMNKVEANLKGWLQNPTWKSFYDEAPSDKCREYIAMDFYASETESEEAFLKMDELLKGLGYEDLNYLYHRSIGPEKAKFAGMIAKYKI